MRLLRLAALVLALGGTAMTASSDEGMWLLNDPPRQLLKERHGFDLGDAWLDKAMKANVRLNSGGSGGFVSPDGLLVTNHHVAADSIQKLSTPGRDLYRDGFLAQTRDAELKCPDMELNVLQNITDVTDKVNAAVTAGMTPAQASAARRGVMAKVEKESLDATGLRSDVVTLYNGGLYHLYRYKKFTDVRLVFAPEKSIAGFGGDVDNFEYPRMNLDVSFFRAYENGQPAKTPDHFRWNSDGPKEGDVVFVTGHPGTTNRLETLAKLKHRRDHTLPYTLARMRAMEAALHQYGEQGPEEHRQAATAHHSAANARKAFSGQLQGLLDPNVLQQKETLEFDVTRRLLDLMPGNAFAAKDYAAAVGRVADAQRQLAGFEREYLLLETGHGFTTDLFTVARHLVRMAEELPKPSAERLREYRDSNLDSLKLQVFSPAPVYPPLERVKLQTALTFLAEQLGGAHPSVQLAHGGKNPAGRADEVIRGTKLADVAERKRLADGGKAVIDASADPLIQLAKAIDADARRVRARFETEVEEPERQAYAELARLRFLALGKSVAPDATFTLRLAFGVVKGYEVGGEKLPFHTTFGGAFERSTKLGGVEPFDLPKRWLDGKAKLDLATPFNFVSTADTIGGNSGSPVLNRAGELVGINFDRNRHGLVRNFVYTEVQARHVAVHSRAVLEALRKLYPAEALVKELTGGLSGVAPRGGVGHNGIELSEYTMSAIAVGTRYKSFADVLARVGHVPPERILPYPAAGSATPEDAFDPQYVGGRTAELVGGILVEKTMGHLEDLIGVRLILALGDYLNANNIGSLSGPQGGYRFKSDLLRIPDASVVLWESVDDTDEIEDPDAAYLRTPPDFVAEVLSPSNTTREMEIKLGEYAKAGVQLVWYVDPDRKVVDVYPKARGKGKISVGLGGTLDGGAVLPGFTLSVAKLFEKRAPAGRKGGKSPKKPKKG